ALCELQSQAAGGGERPRPSPVVQAGPGPPGARGGTGQDDPLSPTGPRYSSPFSTLSSNYPEPHASS
ncbi:unnamed protein product, partial [Tetraodon nigroviridis]